MSFCCLEICFGFRCELGGGDDYDEVFEDYDMDINVVDSLPAAVKRLTCFLIACLR